MSSCLARCLAIFYNTSNSFKTILVPCILELLVNITQNLFQTIPISHAIYYDSILKKYMLLASRIQEYSVSTAVNIYRFQNQGNIYSIYLAPGAIIRDDWDRFFICCVQDTVGL